MNLTVYISALDAEEKLKGSFYDDLKDAVGRFPAGDWSTRPAPVHMATRNSLVRFALDSRRANGDRLVTFPSASLLVVSSTRFHHPRRHLVI